MGWGGEGQGLATLGAVEFSTSRYLSRESSLVPAALPTHPRITMYTFGPALAVVHAGYAHAPVSFSHTPLPPPFLLDPPRVLCSIRRKAFDLRELCILARIESYFFFFHTPKPPKVTSCPVSRTCATLASGQIQGAAKKILFTRWFGSVFGMRSSRKPRSYC